ncbi:MAG: hypothetical protein ACTSQX_07310 [Candidatus Heimdallarchaeota archaeon]
MQFKGKYILVILIPLVLLSNVYVIALPGNNEITDTELQPSSFADDPINETWWGGLQDEGSVYAKVDSEGNLYVTCFSTSFGATSEDVWLVKYNANMNMDWNVTWQTLDNARPSDLVIDSNDDIYISGRIINQTSFDRHAFVLKYDSTGARLWNTTHITLGQNDEATGLALDSNEDIFVTGLSNDPSGDLFIQKYSAAGTYLSTYYYDETLPNVLYEIGAIQIDEEDNFYVVGSTTNAIAGTSKDIFLIKMNSSGNHLWNRTIGKAGSMESDIGTDLDLFGDYIYLTGETDSLANIDRDIIVAKYDKDGNYYWNQTWNMLEDRGIAIDINAYGNLVITGTTDYYNATDDIVVIEMDQNHDLVWNSTWESGGADFSSDVCAYKNFIYSIGYSYNYTSASYDVSIIRFENPTLPVTTTETFPPTGNVGKIIAYIIGVIIVIGAAFVIAMILYTYFTKPKE